MSRKRRPSSNHDDIKDLMEECDAMDECNAALVLMSLSCSPNSPHAGAWGGRLDSSPGSSSASWRSGTPSPALSEAGGTNLSNSVSDEGIAMDYGDEMPRKKKLTNRVVFQCTWPGCTSNAVTCQAIEAHVRGSHLGPKRDNEDLSDHEEEFYYTEVEISRAGQASPPSPPTLSHRDMARPPHEDPEYQRQLVGNFRQGLLTLGQPINIPGTIQHQWSQNHSLNSPQKHIRLSPRPSTSYAPYPSPCPPSPGVVQGATQGAAFLSHSAPSKAPAPLSPSRRLRGENKKCRKVYGMEHREMWCTQCKWKKACTRFGD